MTHTAKALRQAREAANLTRGHVAKKLGFSPQFYGHVESGRSPFPAPYYKKFLKLTGADPERLYEAVMQDYGNYVSAHLPPCE